MQAETHTWNRPLRFGFLLIWMRPLSILDHIRGISEVVWFSLDFPHCKGKLSFMLHYREKVTVWKLCILFVLLPFKKLHTSPEKKVGSFCGVHLLSFKKQSFQRPKKLSPALHGHAMQCQMYCFFVLSEGALFRSRTSNSSLAGSQLELHVLGKSLYHCVDLWVRLCANDSRLRELCSHQKSRAQGEGLTLSTKQGWNPDRPTLCGDCGTGTLPGEPSWSPFWFSAVTPDKV